MVIGRKKYTLDELRTMATFIAVPGTRTTAYLA